MSTTTPPPCEEIMTKKKEEDPREDKEKREVKDQEEVKEQKGEVKWEDLPEHLLNLIFHKLIYPGDIHRFHAVCKAFHNATIAFPPPFISSSSKATASSQPPKEIPWVNGPAIARVFPVEISWEPLSLHLMLRDDDNGDQQVDGAGDEPPLYELPTKKLCMCFGSSLGFLGLFDNEYGFYLLDARTRHALPLPTPDFPDVLKVSKSRSPDGGVAVTYTLGGRETTSDMYRILNYAPTKLVLSSRTSSSPVVMSRLGNTRTMVYCRTGVAGARWAPLPLPETFKCASFTYHEGRFYLLDGYSPGRLLACEISGYSPPVAAVREVPVAKDSVELIYEAMGPVGSNVHLVECCGDLLAVVENAAYNIVQMLNPIGGHPVPSHLRCSFRVFKLEKGKGEEEGRWVEVRDIGRNALFLGLSDAFSVSTRDFLGFRGNCIYFSGWYHLLLRFVVPERLSTFDAIVYDLGEQSLVKLQSCRDHPFLSLQCAWLDPRIQR